MPNKNLMITFSRALIILPRSPND